MGSLVMVVALVHGVEPVYDSTLGFCDMELAMGEVWLACHLILSTINIIAMAYATQTSFEILCDFDPK
jgi:uncharacterized membrane protein